LRGCPIGHLSSARNSVSSLAPGRRSISLKPLAMVTAVVALLFHQPTYGSTLQPKGAVVGAGTSGGGPRSCGVTVANTDKGFGTEGCGPGYYIHHPDSFPSLFPAAAEDCLIPIPDIFGCRITFLQAVEGHGGPGLQGAQDLLIRSGITALLNAAHPDVAYALPMIDVLQLAFDALASSDQATILATSEKFDSLNNRAGAAHCNEAATLLWWCARRLRSLATR
jgi:hypothetical protein